MCGRFTLTLDPGDLQDVLNIDISSVDLIPRYNIAPSQPVAAVRDGVFAQGGAVPVGVGALLGQGCQHRLQDDQCPLGDDQRETFLPGALLAPTLPDPGGWFLRVGSGRGWQDSLLFLPEGSQTLHLCRVVGGMAAQGRRAAAHLHDHHLRGQ